MTDPQAQEDIAPPVMTEIGTSTPLGGIFLSAMYVALSNDVYMASEACRLCHHAVSETGCNMGVQESCMRPSGRKVKMCARVSSTKWRT